MVPRKPCFRLVVSFLCITVLVQLFRISFSKNDESSSLTSATALSLKVGEGIESKNHQSDNENIRLPCGFTGKDSDLMLKSISKGLGFFETYMETPILDVAMGPVIFLAQTNLLLGKVSLPIPKDMKSLMDDLISRSETILQRIVKGVMDEKEISDEEKRRTLPWVEDTSVWQMPLWNSWRDESILKNLELSTNFSKAVLEDRFWGASSDLCISYAFQCENTTLPEHCHEYFFQEVRSSYTLGHQMLFMLIGEQRGCKRFQKVFMPKLSQPEQWDSFRLKLISKAWFLLHVIEHHSFPHGIFKDLFTEFVFIGSLSGHPNFLRRNWLHKIIEWQAPLSGCFQFSNDKAKGTPGYKRVYVGGEFPGNQSKLSEHGKSRRKRNDVIVTTPDLEECHMHFTAVGIASLAMYFRHFMEKCFSDSFALNKF